MYGAANAAILDAQKAADLSVLASFPARDPGPLSRNEEAVALQALSKGQATGLATGRAKGHESTRSRPATVQRSPKEDVLYLPIDTPTRQIGVLEVRGRPDGGRFDDDDRELLGSFADQAALALERVRLTSEAARAEVLAQSDELKSALLASVSHDLRTPLATIKTSVSSLQDDSIEWPPEARAEFLEAIDEETDRLTRMVANLLDLSRIEGGALRPDRDWYDARELVQRVVSRLSARSSATGQRLASRIGPDVTLGYFDYVEVDQVLANLVENAIKYTPAGASIFVAATTIPEGLRFAVRDNGPGIPPAFARAGLRKILPSGQRAWPARYRDRSDHQPRTGRSTRRENLDRKSPSAVGTSVMFTIPFDRSTLREEGTG